MFERVNFCVSQHVSDFVAAVCFTACASINGRGSSIRGGNTYTGFKPRNTKVLPLENYALWGNRLNMGVLVVLLTVIIQTVPLCYFILIFLL